MDDEFTHFLDDSMFLGGDEVARLTGLTIAELDELADCGLFPLLDAAGARRYAASALHAGRRAARLRDAFELDMSALMLVVTLTSRIDELQTRLREIECHLPR